MIIWSYYVASINSPILTAPFIGKNNDLYPGAFTAGASSEIRPS
jgi:hypothetical protein